jgi:hypothetical protein
MPKKKLQRNNFRERDYPKIIGKQLHVVVDKKPCTSPTSTSHPILARISAQ